ncbi:MAG: hypothetical protein PHR26_01090 [Candidatus ainarchaeum sp.]|nr:hypothetical protein [Candidatus ainarchaeum sp.]MDD3975998.1 hypothetical protein [Candidatus ainarchaeum sp.]
MNTEFIEGVTISEVKKILSEKSKEKELNYEQKLAYEHSKLFALITPTNAKKLKDEILEKTQVSNEIATKIVDIIPNKIELDLILEKEKEINDETKEEILKIIEKYKK